MQIKDVISAIEKFAPLSLQEDYDNSGLIIGNENEEVQSVLITVDVIEKTIEEAVKLGSNLIISHHPVIFGGLKKITGRNFTERIIINAIKNNIAIYSAHTNLDNIITGVNGIIADKLGLKDKNILQPKEKFLYKLVTFVPVDHIDKVREAIFNAGAGNIGNYDSCSFNVSGEGTFKGNEDANPFVGKKGDMHKEKEIRIESIFPGYLKNKIINNLLNAHPYEEVAYDIYPLENDYLKAGSGLTGILENEISEIDFLKKVKEIFGTKSIKYSKFLKKPIKKVAICGGSGSFLLKEAIKEKADVFISADIKYHQFFDADNKIFIMDVGHYESEQFTKEIFYNLLTKKFSTFAIHLSKYNTNPINYY